MSDTSTTTDTTLDSKDSSAEPDGTDNHDNDSNGHDRAAEIEELRTQLAKLEADHNEGIKRRDTALTRAQQAEKRLKEIEAKERTARETAAKKEKDIEALQALAKEREDALQAERDAVKAELEAKLNEEAERVKTLKSQLENSVKKAEVLRVLSGICRSENNAAAAEVAYQQLEGSIELVEENGMLKPKAKGSHLPLKDFAEKLLTDKGMDFLLASQRKAGTGTQQQAADQTGTAKPKVSLEELSKMSAGAQKDYFQKNPEAAKELLEGKLS